jgi:HPt (histidine-containing phosphotransfer) domain-containing protein
MDFDDEDIVLEIPGLDVEKGLFFYDYETDIYILSLRSFAKHIPASLDMLRNVSEETLPDYLIKIHGLKGTSANIGAEKTRETASKLEAMAKAGDLNGVLALNEMFIKNTEILLAEIKAWLEKNAPDG